MPDLGLIVSLLLLPLLAFAICLTLLSKKGGITGYFFVIITFISLAISVYIYLNNIAKQPLNYTFNWISVGNYKLAFSIILDKYSMQMLVLVNFISLLVGIFSIEYMHSDTAKHRYFGFLGLFQFAMLGVVLASNLFQMYFFWELVGFCSYLLIGFWYQKAKPIEAAKKAFLINRIGDICFFIGIFMCFNTLGSGQFSSLQHANITVNATLIGLLLFGGCVGKAAQFPLHTWLPDAMEGPTPVSALIHAATMVAAGIYLIIRIFPIFTPLALNIITVIGCISMLMAGIKAIFQKDIKKVLAYSTVSQLGLMVVAVGASAPQFAFNHLLTHAFFKAGLFLSAGSVIHAIHLASPKTDAQDMNLMGGLYNKLPITFFSYIVCAAAMIGIPFFSGFYSKDSILEALHEQNGVFSNIIFYAVLLSSLISAIYLSRQAWLVFGGEKRSQASENEIVENNLWMKIPLLLLALLSTFVTKFLIDLPNIAFTFTTILNTALVFLGIAIVYFYREKLIIQTHYQSKIDLFYQTYFVNNTLLLSNGISQLDNLFFDGITKMGTFITLQISSFSSWVDRNLVDGFVNFTAKAMGNIGRLFSNFQSGQVQWYISAMMLLIFLIFILAGIN